MLYLMKPNILLLLIKGGKRIQRQMMMSRLFAINRVHLADSVGIATKVFYFFLLLLFFVFCFFSFFSLPIQRPKQTPVRRKYRAAAEKRNPDSSIRAPIERTGYHLKEKKMNV